MCRLVLDTSAQLLKKLKEMAIREKELEIALREAQSRISVDAHPLLNQAKQSSQKAPTTGEASTELIGGGNASSDENDLEDDLSHTFGTLSITTDRGWKVSRVTHS